MRVRYIILLTVTILIDQLSKLYLIKHLPNLDYLIEIATFLDLRYAWNYGVSFGFFDNHKEYSNIFFSIFNSAVSCYIYYLFMLATSTLEKYGYVIILGGAIGNLIDRLIHGAVFDFILFHYGNLQFAIFNLADFFVSFGIFLLAIDQVKKLYLKGNPS